MPTDHERAVRQALTEIPHAEGCASLPHATTEYGFRHLTREPCDCDREDRIAAAVVRATRAGAEAHTRTWWGSHNNMNLTQDALTAKMETARDSAALAALKEG